jgi:hypothetical protein
MFCHKTTVLLKRTSSGERQEEGRGGSGEAVLSCGASIVKVRRVLSA